MPADLDNIDALIARLGVNCLNPQRPKPHRRDGRSRSGIEDSRGGSDCPRAVLVIRTVAGKGPS